MRRLLLTENITADGRIEMLDEWFNPSSDGDIQDWLDQMERLGTSSDAVLVGRQTFEDFRGHWPQRTGEPAGAYLDEVQKYVVPSSMTDPQWRSPTILSGDPVEEVPRLKDSDGGDITLCGSITLAHGLLAAGLVDEIRLLEYPAFQGRGRGLVAEGTSAPVLGLLESRAFRSGVALLRYAVTNGSAAEVHTVGVVSGSLAAPSRTPEGGGPRSRSSAEVSRAIRARSPTVD